MFLSFFSLSSLTSLCSQNENTDVAHLYCWAQHYTSITSTLFQHNLVFFLFFKHAVLVSCTSESQNLLHRRQKEKFRSLIEARKAFLQYLQDILEFSLSFAKTMKVLYFSSGKNTHNINALSFSWSLPQKCNLSPTPPLTLWLYFFHTFPFLLIFLLWLVQWCGVSCICCLCYDFLIPWSFTCSTLVGC